MSVRMKDIAHTLGISQTTVSHVLRGRGGEFRIGAETARRVRDTVERLGYRPSVLAHITTFRDRLAGYRQAVAAHGLRPGPYAVSRSDLEGARAQPVEDLGREAVRLLLEEVAEPGGNRHVVLPPCLIVREGGRT